LPENSAFVSTLPATKINFRAGRVLTCFDYFHQASPKKMILTGQQRTSEMDADWGFNFVRIPMAYPSYLHLTGRDI